MTAAETVQPAVRRRRSVLKRVLIGLAAVLLALLLNDLFICEAVVVRASSMIPTILPHERLFLSKFPKPTIRRFDVVVVKSQALGRRVVKRVVGLPGDRIRVDSFWRLVLNGTPVAYSTDEATGLVREANHHWIQLLDQAPAMPEPRFGKDDLLLRPDEYFVVGDNRLSSLDSRAFGPVSGGEIEGRIGLRWFSFDWTNRRFRTDRLLRVVR